MTTSSSKSGAAAGDWVEARGLPGQSTRSGLIVEVLGEGYHEHFRVQWDNHHESILYPNDGVLVLGPQAEPAPR